MTGILTLLGICALINMASGIAWGLFFWWLLKC